MCHVKRWTQVGGFGDIVESGGEVAVQKIQKSVGGTSVDAPGRYVNVGSRGEETQVG